MSKSKRPTIRFDPSGCVVILDPKLVAAMREHLSAGKEVSFRVTESSASAAIVGPSPLPQPTLFRIGCANSMCDCPVDPLEQFVLPPARPKMQSRASQPMARTKSTTKRPRAAGGKK